LSLSNSCIIRKESLFDDENLEVSSDTNTLIEADTKENIARRFIGRLTLGCRTVDIFIAWRHLCCSRADLRRKFKAFQFEQCKRWKQESFSRWQKESLLYHAASNCCTFQLLQKVFKYWVIYSSMAKQKKFYFITANHIRSQRMLTTYLCAWKGKYASRTLMRTVLQSWRAWASQEAMVQRGLREYQERVNRSAALSAFFRWIQACRMTLRVSAFRSHLLVKFFKKWKRASILVKSLRQRANAHIAKVARKKILDVFIIWKLRYKAASVQLCIQNKFQKWITSRALHGSFKVWHCCLMAVKADQFHRHHIKKLMIWSWKHWICCSMERQNFRASKDMAYQFNRRKLV
jgi:hypothetical protein